jgi:hypothetical protein
MGGSVSAFFGERPVFFKILYRQKFVLRYVQEAFICFCLFCLSIGFLVMSFKFNLSYAVALLAGAVVTLSVRYYTASSESVQLRVTGFELQRQIEDFQPKLEAKRKQLAQQQEQLNKGSAISTTIGPAVVSDIAKLADKMSNQKLKDLLMRYDLRDSGASRGEFTPGIPSKN